MGEPVAAAAAATAVSVRGAVAGFDRGSVCPAMADAAAMCVWGLLRSRGEN